VADPFPVPTSLFSGANLLATNVAPWGSPITVILTHGASNGATITRPPNSAAREAVASASSTANVTLQFPTHWGAIKPIDAHTSEFRTGDDDLRWLALRIAMLGVDFEVREPPELADHVRALAARFDRAARSPGGGTVLRP
jgi:WYL domain